MKKLLYPHAAGDYNIGGPHRSSYHYNMTSQPTRTEKIYKAKTVIYLYMDGTVEIAKDRNGDLGMVDIDKVSKYFSQILAEMKLKRTQLDMFKEGLSELLYEAIQKTLKGEYYERDICDQSTRNGSECNRSA